MDHLRHYDVIVAGGGPAGVTAAMTAARNGAKTLLIERDGYLGGMATGASIPAFCTFTNGKETVVQGIGLEILEELKQITWRSPFYDRRPDRTEGLDWLPIDAEALKLVLDRMVSASGVQILLHTSLIGCKADGGWICELEIHNKSGLGKISADVYIDCTGDGDLAALSGCETEFGDEKGQVQGGTLCFKIANFDTERFLAYAKEAGEDGNLSRAVEKAKKDGVFPEDEVKVAGIALPCPGMATFNFGHVFGWNPVNGDSVTRAEIAARERLPELMHFIRSYVPGAEESVLACSGPNIGVRESRRVRGRYYLTEADYKRRADFEDSIAYYSYPIDFHASSGSASAEKEALYQSSRYAPGESYGIPYRCLLPAGVDNLLVAGRTVSCDRAMQASLRVMPACFAMGQAAGTAAALAVRKGISVPKVAAPELRQLLKEQGCYIKQSEN